jgi:transcriptional regulator with XRE-family HTH domain
VERFAENVQRLLGVHRLEQKEAAALMGFSVAAFTKWFAGARNPSFTSALQAGDFFQIPADRLAREPFENLLERELADPQRFREVEAEIRRRRSILREAGDQKPDDGTTEQKIIAMSPRSREQESEGK